MAHIILFRSQNKTVTPVYTQVDTLGTSSTPEGWVYSKRLLLYLGVYRLSSAENSEKAGSKNLILNIRRQNMNKYCFPTLNRDNIYHMIETCPTTVSPL